jgi:hypothetical protein
MVHFAVWAENIMYFWHFAFLNQSEDGSDYETEFTIIVSRIDDDKLPISSVVNTILYRKGL